MEATVVTDMAKRLIEEYGPEAAAAAMGSASYYSAGSYLHRYWVAVRNEIRRLEKK